MKQMSVKLVVLAAMAGLGMTGCATSGMSVTEEPAPITYKMDEGAAHYASLPRGLKPIERPNVVNPIGGQGPDFDPSKVDRQLYAHQKVGRRYTIMGKSYTPRHEPNYDKVGTSSWYGPKFNGKPTATGEIFNMRDMTAAHKTLPLNSMLYVTNLENGRSAMLRLNDRGPFIGDRVLDVSEAASEVLGFKHKGTASVRIVYAGPADPMAAGRAVPKIAPRPTPIPEDNYVERAPRLPAPLPSPRPAPIEPIPSPAVPYDLPPVQSAPQRSPQPVAPRQPVAEAPALPPRPAPRAPSAMAPYGQGPTAGENVTMTIKGPIHIARSDQHTHAPEIIQAPTIVAQPDW